MALILITHDLGVVAGMADRIAVMYGGRIVEEGPTDPVFEDPHMPYTVGLLRSTPRLDRPDERRLQPIRGRSGGTIGRSSVLPVRAALRPRADHLHEGGAAPRAGRVRSDSARPATLPRMCRTSCIRNAGDDALMRRPHDDPSPRSRHVKIHFPVRGRFLFGKSRGRRKGGRWRELRHPPRRDAWPRGRKRLRQDDRSDAPSCSSIGSPRARSSSTARISRPLCRGNADAAAPHPAYLSGSLREPQSAHERRPRDRGTDPAPRPSPRRACGPGARARTPLPRRPSRRPRVPLSARVLRRAAAAHRHRAGARLRAGADRVRRARLGA